MSLHRKKSFTNADDEKISVSPLTFTIPFSIVFTVTYTYKTNNMLKKISYSRENYITFIHILSEKNLSG